MKFILTTTLIALTFIAQAQKATELGSTKPFMVGLKGTIYPFKFNKYLEIGKIGYHDSIEKMTPIGYVYTQSLNISERELTLDVPVFSNHAFSPKIPEGNVCL